MGRAILLGLCPDSLHKAEVWACALGLRFGSAHVLLSAPSVTPQPLAEAGLGKGDECLKHSYYTRVRFMFLVDFTFK